MTNWLRVCGRLLVAALLVLGIGSCGSRPREALRWGGDQEGGGPYIFSPPDKPDVLIGFEIDLMDRLAARLKLKSEFRQCEWQNLPDLLASGGIDCIVNGYELTSERLQTHICTIPYYVNELQLIGRRDDATLTAWDDLRLRPGQRKKRVGVLGDTAAEKYLKLHYPNDVEIVAYTGTTQPLDQVANKQLDATVTDVVAALFYKDRYLSLRPVGERVGRGYFVMYLRPGDEKLRDELNAGIRALLENGELQQVYEKYGIWNAQQADLTSEHVQLAPEQMQPPHGRARGWAVIRDNLPLLLTSAGVTVLLSITSMPLAIIIGLLVALGRLYGPRILRVALAGYVEVLRGTPLMLQLFVLFYVVPSVIPIPTGLAGYFPWLAAIAGLAINYSAYEAEIYRAGLLAIPAGQMEAALALGMSRRQALLHVIIPQAVRLVVPPVTNDFIALFKDTSVCSVVTLIELSKRYSIVANNTGAPIEIAAATAVLYLLMSYPLALLSRRLERQRARVNV